MATKTFKSTIQVFLKQAGLYQRVKSSWLYDAYWAIADRRLIDEREQEIRFHRETLAGFEKNDLIFDIGANLGHKTDIFLRLGARVVAVEPDSSNQEILRQRFLAHRLRKKPVVIVGKAVSDRNGFETMWVDEPGSAKNSLNPKWVETLRTDAKRFGGTLQFNEQKEVETITLEQMIARHGRPFYIKIDVEGYEPMVLKGLRSVVPYISFEVNLPEFQPEAKQCIDWLEDLAPQGEFSYAADCRLGLVPERWLPKGLFLQLLNSCVEPCVEIFWKAPGQLS